MKKISKILVAIMLLFVCCMPVFLSGCNNQVYINTTTNNYSYGEAYGKGLYINGAKVTITAVPNKGYEFVQWDDGNTDNPRKITVSGEETYKAQFRESQLYALQSVQVYRPDVDGKSCNLWNVYTLEIEANGDNYIVDYESVKIYFNNYHNMVPCADANNLYIYAWYNQYNVFDFNSSQSLKFSLSLRYYDPDLTGYEPEYISNYETLAIGETLTFSKNQMTSSYKSSTNEYFLSKTVTLDASFGDASCEVQFRFVKI